MKLLFAVLTLFLPVIAFGQDTAPELGSVSPEVIAFSKALGPYITAAITEFPILANFVAILGSLRMIFKPLMSLIWSIVNVTTTGSDNEKYNKVTNHKLFGIFAYLLDYAASIKAKNPKA